MRTGAAGGGMVRTMKPILFWLALSVLLSSSAALGEETNGGAPAAHRGQGWSLLSGQTVGQGRTGLLGQVGWPGFSLSVLHGAATRVDVGGRFSFNYGYEGIVTSVIPGLKLQGLLRVGLLDRERASLGLHFMPGPLFYFPGRFDTIVGMALPVGLTLGIAAGSAAVVNLGFDLPMFVTFGPGGGLMLPVLMGGGIEYFVDRDLAVTFNTRMGPAIDATRTRYYTANLAFEALVGVAYRL